MLYARYLFSAQKISGFLKYFSTSFSCFQNEKSMEFYRRLETRIKICGPITVAEYMKLVLTDPLSGYYINKTAIGAAGDFITSPEISQMFGELIAIWFLNEWIKVGKPTPLNIVEFGPGTGTLSLDLLRVFDRLVDGPNPTILRLVEVSRSLSRIQEEKLCGPEGGDPQPLTGPAAAYKSRTSQYGAPVYWYDRLTDVPSGFSFYLANEFFDALPVHKLRKTASGWREVLIDLDPASRPPGLRFVLAPGETAACKLLKPPEEREEVEWSLQAAVILEEMARRMKEEGGAALIVDYGHEGDKSDTFRAFRRHAGQHPLFQPGDADLTADVDFSYLKRVIGHRALVFGPVTQQKFLEQMGIGLRLQNLLKAAGPEVRKQLISGYRQLTLPDQMGERFKFLALFPRVLRPLLEKYPPAGFSPHPLNKLPVFS